MIDNKQFVIMTDTFENENFKSIKLSSGKILSYHYNLPIQFEQDNNGAAKFCILGYAFQTDEHRGFPIDEIRAASENDDINNIVESWAGRWLLIYENTIYMDACGLLGCFYTSTGIISSSIHCLNTILKQKTISPRIKHRFGLDYFPGPDTPYPYIKRLMPSQTLNITDMTCGKRVLIIPRTYENNDERIDDILQCTKTLFHNLQKQYDGKIMVPLTGGYDSRTLMALLEYSGIDYSLFTLEHDNIDEDDILLPPLLAEIVNKNYTYTKREGSPSPQLYQEYDLHCAKMAIDEDRSFYAYGQYPGKTEKTAVLRAGIWECAWGKYYKRIHKCGTNISKYEDKYVNIRCRNDMRASLKKWLKHAKQDEQNIALPNRFYWEQRIGCWLSSVEQSLTIIDHMDSLQLCNCNRLLSILLSFDLETRRDKQHQLKIIEKACPRLLEIPFASPKKKSAPPTQKQKLNDEFTYLMSCIKYLDLKPGLKEAASHAKKNLKTNA